MKQKGYCLQVNNEPLEHIIKTEHFSNYKDSSSESENESEEKVGDLVLSTSQHPLSIK